MMEDTRSDINAKVTLEHLVSEDFEQIQRDGSEETMAFVSLEHNQLSPMEQNLRRISAIGSLPAVIKQTNILETLTNIRRNRDFAVGETSERLKNGAEELEKSNLFISEQKAEYEKLIELLKEAENDIREVMCGIEDEHDGGDDEFASLCQKFRALKADLKYVLQTFCPEYKKYMENFLKTILESDDEDEWVKVPEDMDVGAIMLLLRSKIIVQHPEQNEYFKLAPLC